MKLLELRQKNKLSQQELCAQINLTQEKYSRLETNTTKIDAETLIKIANFYKVSLDYLCDRQYNNNVGYIPDDKKEVVKNLLQLNDKDLENVKGYICALLDK